MLPAAAKYGYLNAKVRALRSRKLTQEDHHFLLAAKDLPACLSYLATTSYSSCLPEFEQEAPELRFLERQLARPLLTDYAKIIRSLRGAKQQEVILALFRRFEAENLKILLRAQFAHLTREAVSHLLYPIAHISRLPWDTLWACTSIQQCIEHLPPDIFGRSLQNALPQFDAQGRLFPLEMALDFSCFHLLWEAIYGLGKSYNRTVSKNIIALYIDILNTLWVIRLKIEYQLPAEEIVNYTIPGGNIISLTCLNSLARVQDITTFINLLPHSFHQQLSEIKDWGNIDRSLEAYFLHYLARVFSGQPFHIGIAVAYLLEKEIELSNLITLLQMKALNFTIKESRARLSWQLQENGYVPAS